LFVYLLNVLEVLLRLLGVSDHSGGTRSPVAGDDVAGLFVVLEGLEEAEGLIDVAANGEVVDGDLTDVLGGVDDEDGAEGNTGVSAVFDEDAVVLGDLLGDVGDEGDVHLAEAALVAGLHRPGEVGELRVDGPGENFGVEGLELGGAVRVLDDFGGADEGEVEGIREEDDPLALVVRELDVLEGLVRHDGDSVELRSRLSDDGGHCLFLFKSWIFIFFL